MLFLQQIRDKGKQFLPGSEGVGGRGGIRGRNDPNIVCTYE
jgi:hypothetical protein